MSTLLDRGAFTDWTLAQLRAALQPDFLVGDAEAPVDAGWQGAPNAPASSFQPYVVLGAQNATRSQGTFADSQDTWQLPYSLISLGVQRVQADFMAQRALETLDATRKAKVPAGEARWKIMEVTASALGGVVPQDSTEPPLWRRLDLLTFFITKERT